MAFPTSPTNGQTTTVNNILYRYNLSANRWERVLTSVNTLVSSDGTTTANLTLSNTGTLILTSPLGYTNHTFANDAYGNLIIDNAIGLKADVGAIQVGGTGGQFPTLYSNGVLESAQYGSISLSSIQEFSLDSFNSVQVDQNGVTIGTNLLDTSKYWSFGLDGLLTFPDGTTNSGATVIALGVYDIQSIGNTLIQTSAAQGAQTWTFATNGSLTFPDSTIQTTAYPGTNIGNAINIGTTSSNIFIPNTNTQALGLINSLAGVYIEAGTPQKVWQFNTNGTLTFPDATVQTTAYLGTATNIANGGTGGIPYQSAPGITKFINIGANTTVLQSNGTTATWVTTASLSVGLATTATSLGSGIINISNKTSSTSTTTGALQVVGGVGIGGAVYIGQTSYINNSQILTSSTFGQFITSGVSSVNAGTDTAINTSTGAVTIWNTSTLQSITNRGNSTTNVVLIANTSSSTSTNTGALVVSGGVGISGGVYVGGTITATNITVRSATGALFVGDFDNLTVNNRTNFITNTVNSSTGIYAIPNGTSGAASWQAANNSNLTNASKILIATNGSTDVQLVSGINGSGTYLPLSFYNGGVQQMVLSTTGTLTINTGSLIITTGTIYGLASPGTTSTSGASQVGYLGMPQQSKSSAYTTVISDAGKHIYVTATATITIDSNANVAYPIGTTIAFIAAAGATVTIAITSDTMYLGGTGTTGSRTLAAYGMATAVKVTSTSWFINGTGLT